MATLAFATEQHPAPTPPERRAAVLQDPGFGRVFTDHMVAIRYREGKGWHDAKITARVAIPMDPAAAVLHYSQQIFEGLKAYRTADGGAVMFRPEANARRFQKSAQRSPFSFRRAKTVFMFSVSGRKLGRNSRGSRGVETGA